MSRAAWASLVVLAGCGDASSTALGPCEGAGDPEVELGTGNTSFVPWSSGDVVSIEQSGTYGFWTTLETTGLDTTSPVTTFLRFTVGDETSSTDAGGTVTFQCQDDGSGNATVFAALADELQTADAVAAVDGQALHLSATLTDAAGDTAAADLDLVLDAP